MKDARECWCSLIDVTNLCGHRCSNCTRLVGHSKPFVMDVPTFKAAVDSYEGWPAIVGIIGGDPMLNPDILEMIDYFASKFPFEKRAIFLSTFGKNNQHRGLVEKMFPRQHIYLGEHKVSSWHQPLLVASKDLIPDEDERRWWIDRCWVANQWSCTVTPKGCYRCEIMATFDMVLGLNKGVPIEKGWWNRPMSCFAEQVEAFCHRCGMCVPQRRRKDIDCLDDVSVSNLDLAIEGRSHVVDVSGYNPNQVVDWFPREYRRESKKFWGVVVSVGYGDILRRTLKFNAPHMEKILVVTTPNDVTTKEVCVAYDNVQVLTTSLFYEFGAVFNKGAAVELATCLLPRDVWCLIFDADICLPQDTVLTDLLDPQCLYGAKRFMVYTEEQYKNATRVRNFDCTGLDDSPGDGLPGFFQLFNTGAEALTMRPWYGVTYSNASWCDCDFHNRWSKSEWRYLDINVLHLGDKENWEGKVEGVFPRPSAPPVPEKDKRRRIPLTTLPKYIMQRISEEVRQIRAMDTRDLSTHAAPKALKAISDDALKVLVLVPIKTNLHVTLKKRCLEQLDMMKREFGSRMVVVVDERGTGDKEMPHLVERVSNIYAIRQQMIDEYLKDEHTHVLWVDADVRFDVDVVRKMMAYRYDIIAPMVLYDVEHDDVDCFYDTAGFVENGRMLPSYLPYFRQNSPVVEMDSVGAFYMIPAEVFRLGARYYPVSGFVEHFAVCEFARMRGVKVLCDTRLVVYHPPLRVYGEVRI